MRKVDRKVQKLFNDEQNGDKYRQLENIRSLKTKISIVEYGIEVKGTLRKTRKSCSTEQYSYWSILVHIYRIEILYMLLWNLVNKSHNKIMGKNWAKQG